MRRQLLWCADAVEDERVEQTNGEVMKGRGGSEGKERQANKRDTGSWVGHNHPHNHRQDGRVTRAAAAAAAAELTDSNEWDKTCMWRTTRRSINTHCTVYQERMTHVPPPMNAKRHKHHAMTPPVWLPLTSRMWLGNSWCPPSPASDRLRRQLHRCSTPPPTHSQLLSLTLTVQAVNRALALAMHSLVSARPAHTRNPHCHLTAAASPPALPYPPAAASYPRLSFPSLQVELPRFYPPRQRRGRYQQRHQQNQCQRPEVRSR